VPQPDDPGWSFDQFSIVKLDGDPPLSFDCGNEEQNEYLLYQARQDQETLIAVTYLLHVKGIEAAYLTFCMDSLQLGHEQPEDISRGQVPALKLAQLGVSVGFQGFRLGKYLVGLAIKRAIQLSNEVGCRYLTVDARPDVVSFYQDQGFVKNKVEQRRRRKLARKRDRDLDQLSVSMRFDIREWKDQLRL
jgi:GNAT superfamily N-acetyltransferase